MRIDAGRFSFVTPANLDDTTGYTFKSGDDREVLTVSRGAVPAGVSGLDALLEDRKSGLLGLMGDRVALESPTTTTLGPWPARALSFTFQDRRESFREHWAVALLSAREYVQLSYATRDRDPAAVARFEAILGSAALEGSPERASHRAPEGLVSRWAGAIYVDVPAGLAPPRTYSFGTADEALQLWLTAYSATSATPLEPSLEQEIRLEDEKVGVVRERRTSTCTIGERAAECATYAFDLETPDGNVEYTCRRVRLPLENGVRLHVYARSTDRDGAKLAALVDSLLSSVQPS